jgi:ectoine hydroxylase-related dioxygenase (phytanoyl-CoA dioxygenase family)
VTLTHVPADTDSSHIATLVAEHGAVIVDGVLPLDVLDQFTEEITPHIEANGFGTDDFSGRQTRRTGALIARSRAARQIAMHPTVLDVVGGAIDAQKFQLHLTQEISLSPGQGGQPMHRDQWAWDQYPFVPGKEVEVAVIYAMSDFTEENGATRVIPGSHRWADKLRPTADQTVPAEMAKGSILFYVGSLYHGGGANRSTSPRRGINVGYTLSWLRQEENQYLACPPEVARTLPVELAKVIGYRRGAYALGYVGDLQDPREILHPKTSVSGCRP